MRLLTDRPYQNLPLKMQYDGMKKIAKSDRIVGNGRDEHGLYSLIEENILLTAGRDDNASIRFPDGLALKIPKGKYLILEFHYTPSGRVEHNRAQVELSTYPEGETTHLRLIKRLNFARGRNGFTIPAGAKDFIVRSSAVLDRDISVLAFHPHLHFRGKSVKFSAVFPDGHEATLVSVPGFQMKFQITHFLNQAIYLPRGTTLKAEVVYDNSKENAQNPDATRAVPLGSQTYTDEMHQLRLFYVEGEFHGPMQKGTVADQFDRLMQKVAEKSP